MIVIGCAPSSGSSLLTNILNRHSQLSCGPETALFARMDLMIDWEGNKKLLYQKSWRKLRDHGWHRYRGVNWKDEFYPWSRSRFIDIVSGARTFQEFIRTCELDFSPNLWIEKTPSNIYSFGWLREHMKDVCLVKIIRDPYDSIASLIARGYGIVYAVGLFLLHNSAGIFESDRDILFCKYENLVTEPEYVMKGLLESMKLPWESTLLTPENRNIIMPGWNHDETGPIRSSSIGRFDSLNSEIQNEIIHAVNDMSVNIEFQIPCQTWSVRNIEEICDLYNYSFKKPSGNNTHRLRHKQILLQEKLRRTITGYSTHWFNFPLAYKSQ